MSCDARSYESTFRRSAALGQDTLGALPGPMREDSNLRVPRSSLQAVLRHNIVS